MATKMVIECDGCGAKVAKHKAAPRPDGWRHIVLHGPLENVRGGSVGGDVCSPICAARFFASSLGDHEPEHEPRGHRATAFVPAEQKLHAVQ